MTYGEFWPRTIDFVSEVLYVYDKIVSCQFQHAEGPFQNVKDEYGEPGRR